MAPKSKKKNYKSAEIDQLLSEVEQRKSIIFSSVSGGVRGPEKNKEWEKITAAVNSVSSVPRTVAEIKKKWFDMKLDSKKRLSNLKRSMTATGGGQQDTKVRRIDERIRGIIGNVALSGVTADVPLDTDLMPAAAGDTGKALFLYYEFMQIKLHFLCLVIS